MLRQTSAIVAGAGGSGGVCFGQVIDRTIEWNKLSATLEENNRIRIYDVMSETYEDLDFRDRVIKVSAILHLLDASKCRTCTVEVCLYAC